MKALTDKLRVSEKQARFFEEELKLSKSRIQELNAELTDTEKKFQTTIQQIREANLKEIQSTYSENQNLKLDREKLEKTVFEKETEIEKMKSVLLSKGRENEELTQDNLRLKQKCEEAISEADELRKRLSQQKNIEDQANEMNSDLKQKIESLKVEATRAKEDVKDKVNDCWNGHWWSYFIATSFRKRESGIESKARWGN